MTTTTNRPAALNALFALHEGDPNFIIALIDAITDDTSTLLARAIIALRALLDDADWEAFLLTFDICPTHLTDLDTCRDDDNDDLHCPFID